MKKTIATIALLFSLTLAGSSAHAATTVPGCPVGYNCIPIVQTTAPVCPQGYTCTLNSSTSGTENAGNTGTAASTYVPGSFYNSYLSNLNNNTANNSAGQNASQYTNATNTSSGANLGGSQGASQNSNVGNTLGNVASTTIPLQPSLASPDLTGCSRVNGSSTPLTTDLTSDGILIPAIHGHFTMDYSIPIECLLTNLGIDESMRDNNIRMGLFMETGSNTGKKVLDVKMITPRGASGVDMIKKYFSAQAISSCPVSNVTYTQKSTEQWLSCIMHADGYRPADYQEILEFLNSYPDFVAKLKNSSNFKSIHALGSLVETSSPSNNEFNPSIGINGIYNTLETATNPFPSFFVLRNLGYIMIVKDSISPTFTAKQIDMLPTDKAKGSSVNYTYFTPEQYSINVDYGNSVSYAEAGGDWGVDPKLKGLIPTGQKTVTMRFVKVYGPILDPVTHKSAMINGHDIKGLIDNYAEEHGYRVAISSEVEALFNQYPNIVVPRGNQGMMTDRGKEFIEGLGETNSCGGFPMIYNPFGKAQYYCCVHYFGGISDGRGGIIGSGTGDFPANVWKFAVVKI
ncbi:MAG: hypothetical protein WCK03_01520 [Candidatus Taylorbacteria bacterium]